MTVVSTDQIFYFFDSYKCSIIFCHRVELGYMDSKLNKIRRSFAIQLATKHRLKLAIPNPDESSALFELYLREISCQLNEKLEKQNAELTKESSSYSPISFQRKQLLKDLDDFQILQKGQDMRRLQDIIERVEHMEMFNTKNQIKEMPSAVSLSPSVVTPIFKSSPKICSYRALCNEFLNHLHWPSELFAHEYDRCFCKTCYTPTMPNVCQATLDNRYSIIIPRNWVKFGLKVDEVQVKIHQVWDRWAISYHGTLPSAALSMVKHRQICLPGDTLADGTRLAIRPGHIPDQRAFFTSPTIRYAAQNHYATAMKFTSMIDKCVYTAKIVLRCRQMPDTFVIQSQTLSNGQMNESDFCDFVPDEQIEWKTDQRGTVIFDGLCVRLKRWIEPRENLNTFNQTLQK